MRLQASAESTSLCKDFSMSYITRFETVIQSLSEMNQCDGYCQELITFISGVKQALLKSECKR